uniref:Uncharacterized protein n=1 Tax=Meloidogyne hapla TaxID=6305 RepID=A0A1I8B931_MELHA
MMINVLNKFEEGRHKHIIPWTDKFKYDIESKIKEYEDGTISQESIRIKTRTMLEYDHYKYLYHKFNTDKDFLEKFKLINGTKSALALSDRQLLIKHYLQALFPENIKDQLINQMGADFVVWLRFIVSELRNKQKWKLADFNVSETKKFDQEFPIYYYIYDVIFTESFIDIKGRTGNFLLKSMANVKNRFDIYLESNEMTIQLREKESSQINKNSEDTELSQVEDFDLNPFKKWLKEKHLLEIKELIIKNEKFREEIKEKIENNGKSKFIETLSTLIEEYNVDLIFDLIEKYSKNKISDKTKEKWNKDLDKQIKIIEGKDKSVDKSKEVKAKKKKKNRTNKNKNESSNEIPTQNILQSVENIASSSNTNLEIKKKIKKKFIKKEDDYFGLIFDKEILLKWNIKELANEENNSKLISKIYKDFIENPEGVKKFLLNVAACIGEIVGRFKVKYRIPLYIPQTFSVIINNVRPITSWKSREEQSVL